MGRGQVSRVEVEVSRPVASRAFGARRPFPESPLGRGLLAGRCLYVREQLGRVRLLAAEGRRKEAESRPC